MKIERLSFQFSVCKLRNGAPIVGSISCGTPGEAEEHIEDTVKLPKSIFGDGPLFILRASGESMIEAGIDSGDLVVVRQQQQTANSGTGRTKPFWHILCAG